MKIILNKCYGGFGVSPDGYKKYCEKKGLPCFVYDAKIGDFYTFVKTDSPSDYARYSTKDFGNIISANDFYALTAKNDCQVYLSRDYRTDPVLIEVVEELGDEVNTFYSRLIIVDIPDDMNYVIDDYDGIETLHERVQVW